MSSIRTKLVTGAAVCAAAVGGATIANAASSTTSSSSSSTPAAAQAPTGQPPQGPHTFNGKTETPLTGDTAAKVRAAALAKVSGTVERVETNVDDSTPYEAHVVKSDGSQVIVEVNSDFTVASVQQMGGMHP